MALPHVDQVEDENGDLVADARPRRSLRTWLTLLVVWSVGLLMWAVYVAFAFFVLARIFGGTDPNESP